MGLDCTTQPRVNARARVYRYTWAIAVNCPVSQSIEPLREKSSFPSIDSKARHMSEKFADPSDFSHRSDSSWEATSRCIDQVWNSLNALLGKQIDPCSQANHSDRILQVCPSPYTLVTPTSFYPSCYRINEQSVLENQTAAIDTCRTQRAQLVWFQSIDELQQHVAPALITHGLTRGSIHRPSITKVRSYD